ncbi:S-adenosyl-L-methionine-dependent methyltransferase, partial [Phyllosticta citricarpa]
YPNPVYYMPCDSLEQTRIEILHRIFLVALDGALTTVPLSPAVQRILDVGTGPGEWATQMADHYPDADIVAVDLAVPDHDDSDGNDDDESDSGIASWDFSEPFDFIHIRNMKGAFRDWGTVFREAYSNLVPGGVLEVVDLLMQFPPSSPDPDASTPSALQTLVTATIEAASRAGRPMSLSHIRSPTLLAACGFVDIHTHVIDLPLGPWPNDEKRALMGKMWLVACAEGIEALCLRLLTRVAGWSVERVREMVAVARAELLEGRHGGVKTEVVFAWGRRPRGRPKGKSKGRGR